MTARGESVTYEVRLEVDEAIAADVDAWLPEHVAEMLRLPGFTSAQVYDDAPLPVPRDHKVRRTVRYELASSDALTAYLRDHAARMRQEGAQRFGDRMSATRRVLQPVDTAPVGEVRTCSNCHAPLTGQYCAVCGQRDRTRMISVWELVADFAGEFFDFDSRFWRTLFPLMFRPGRLTAEYLRGRRVHYTPPLRLYVISSVLFFLLATLGGVEGDLSFDEKPETPATQDGAPPTSPAATPSTNETANPDDTTPTAEEELGQSVPDTAGLPPEAARAIEEAKRVAHEAAAQAHGEGSAGEKAKTEHDGFMVGPEKCTLGDFVTGNEFIDGPVRARLQTACQHIVADKGKSFVRQLVQNIPKMLFFFLPVVALAMKPLYLRPRRYYVEHLLFFVHVHSFVFAALTLTLVVSALKTIYPGLGVVKGLTIAAVSIYIPYYLFRALRVVYGQGRFVTLLKYIVLFFTYIIGSSIIFAIGALFTALTV
jgi:hypothetical protein